MFEFDSDIGPLTPVWLIAFATTSQPVIDSMGATGSKQLRRSMAPGPGGAGNIVPAVGNISKRWAKPGSISKGWTNKTGARTDPEIESVSGEVCADYMPVIWAVGKQACLFELRERDTE